MCLIALYERITGDGVRNSGAMEAEGKGRFRVEIRIIRLNSEISSPRTEVS